MNDLIEILRMLKYKNSLVNETDKLKRTPLHWACKRGYDKIVEILVDFGADVTKVDYLGRTCRDIAASKENK